MTLAWRTLSWKRKDDWTIISRPFGYYVQEEPSPLGTYYSINHENKHIGGSNYQRGAKEMAERHFNTGSVSEPRKPKAQASGTDETTASLVRDGFLTI